MTAQERRSQRAAQRRLEAAIRAQPMPMHLDLGIMRTKQIGDHAMYLKFKQGWILFRRRRKSPWWYRTGHSAKRLMRQMAARAREAETAVES
jgi:hypothetical protein